MISESFLRLGFYYHVPAVWDGECVRLPGFLGRFLDSLAKDCDQLICFLHEAESPANRSLCDYTLRSANITGVNFGFGIPLCLGYWRKHSDSLTFHHAEYRFMNKIKFIKDFIDLHEKKIDSLSTDFTKDNINTHLEKRYHSFIKHFPYDRAMLMAEIGMFQEAKREFANFLQRNYSLKNIYISYLFSLSGLLHYDLVNPIRKLKEKLVAQ